MCGDGRDAQVNEYPAPVGSTTTVAENLALTSVIFASIPSNDPDAGAVATYSFQDGNAGARCVQYEGCLFPMTVPGSLP